jgi:hypothetical protein
MAVPRLQEVARRLQVARHEAAVEDHLEGTPPLVRLRFRPWRGPLSRGAGPAEGTLEIALADGGEGQVVARAWLDASTDVPDQEARVHLSRLGAAWLEARVLDFVGRLLANA